MEKLRGVGCTVGEYAGDGIGEADTSDTFMEAVDEYLQPNHGEYGGVSAAHSKPLLVLYNCEVAELSISSDHLTDIGSSISYLLFSGEDG